MQNQCVEGILFHEKMSQSSSNFREATLTSAFSWAVDHKDKKRKISAASSSKSGAKLASSPPSAERVAPLIDVLAPDKKSQLLVHPNKIKSVAGWLDHVFKEDLKHRPIFLVVSGPAGSGKLTTCKVLASERDIQVIEYEEPLYIKNVFLDERNDSDEDRSKYDYNDNLDNQSQIKSLRSFLTESNTFFKKQKRLIVLKELPTTLLQDPDRYHPLWQWYYQRFHKKGVPVVFILTTETGRDSIIGRLFPKQMKDDINVDQIQFNAPTKKQIVKWLAKKLEDKVSIKDLESVISDDKCDIRSVINSIGLKYGSSIGGSRSLAQSKQIKKRRLDPGSRAPISVSILIGDRDHMVDIHHFLARILYCKRLPRKPSNHVPLPSHLKQFDRDPLARDPSVLCDSVPVDTHKLTLYLHRNYLDFCADLECAASSVEWLSLADTIRGDTPESEGSSEVYKTSLAVSGLMYDLCPQKGEESRRFHPISYNHDYFNAQRKANDAKYELNRVHHKFPEHSPRDLMHDILPYLSVMRSDRHPMKSRYGKRILDLTRFRDIQTGGFESSREPFYNRHTYEPQAKYPKDDTISMQMDEKEDEIEWNIECSDDSD